MMVKVFLSWSTLIGVANSRLNSNAKSSSVAIFISELLDELSPRHWKCRTDNFYYGITDQTIQLRYMAMEQIVITIMTDADSIYDFLRN